MVSIPRYKATNTTRNMQEKYGTNTAQFGDKNMAFWAVLRAVTYSCIVLGLAAKERSKKDQETAERELKVDGGGPLLFSHGDVDEGCQ